MDQFGRPIMTGYQPAYSAPQGMSNGMKAVIAIGILAVLYFIFKDKVDAWVAGLGLGADPKAKWRFFQGVDSNGNDIGNYPGSLAEIKAKCNSMPNCKGFNDNGWIKHTLLPRSDWDKYKWTTEPNKGFRVHSDRVPELATQGVPEFE